MDRVDHHTKIVNAKLKLMLSHPYFGSIVTMLNIIPNELIATSHHSDDKLEYNEDYLDMLTTDEVATILANASMHQMLYHTSRGEKHNSQIWYIASDYAINDLLIQNGFTMPPMAHYSSRFEKLYAEQIYTILQSEDNTDENQEEMDPKESTPTPESTIEIPHDEYEQLLEQILSKLRDRGELPRGLERFVDSAIEPRIDWREHLYRYLNHYARSDYRMSPPSKKHLYRGVALPSIYGQELHIAVAIDTSGSIDDTLLATFLSELSGIMQIFNDFTVELIECDETIQSTQRLTPQEPLIPTLRGGGGTSFIPVFEYIEELHEDFRLLIYFTDGKGTYPSYTPNIETLWLLTDTDTTVPFGESLFVE